MNTDKPDNRVALGPAGPPEAKQMAWEHTENWKHGTISLADAAEGITSKPPSHTPVRVEGSLVSMAIRHPENIIFKFHSTTYLMGLLVIGHNSLSLDWVPFGIPKRLIIQIKDARLSRLSVCFQPNVQRKQKNLLAPSSFQQQKKTPYSLQQSAVKAWEWSVLRQCVCCVCPWQ